MSGSNTSKKEQQRRMEQLWAFISFEGYNPEKIHELLTRLEKAIDIDHEFIAGLLSREKLKLANQDAIQLQKIISERIAVPTINQEVFHIKSTTAEFTNSKAYWLFSLICYIIRAVELSIIANKQKDLRLALDHFITEGLKALSEGYVSNLRGLQGVEFRKRIGEIHNTIEDLMTRIDLQKVIPDPPTSERESFYSIDFLILIADGLLDTTFTGHKRTSKIKNQIIGVAFGVVGLKKFGVKKGSWKPYVSHPDDFDSPETTYLEHVSKKIGDRKKVMKKEEKFDLSYFLIPQ